LCLRRVCFDLFKTFESDLSETDNEDYKNIKFDETMYKFKHDQLPSSRNVFYQICDIEDDEVQAIVHSNDGTVRLNSVLIVLIEIIINKSK
jgi:hypothetical protein